MTSPTDQEILSISDTEANLTNTSGGLKAGERGVATDSGAWVYKDANGVVNRANTLMANAVSTPGFGSTPGAAQEAKTGAIIGDRPQLGYLCAVAGFWDPAETYSGTLPNVISGNVSSPGVYATVTDTSIAGTDFPAGIIATILYVSGGDDIGSDSGSYSIPNDGNIILNLADGNLYRYRAFDTTWGLLTVDDLYGASLILTDTSTANQVRITERNGSLVLTDLNTGAIIATIAQQTPVTKAGIETALGISTLSGLVKMDGSGNLTAAVAGADYEAAIGSQSANKVFAGPSTDGPASPSFRALVASDIPALPYDASGAAAAVSLSSLNGQAKITASGILKGNGAGGVSAAVAGTDYDAGGAAAAAQANAEAFASGLQSQHAIYASTLPGIHANSNVITGGGTDDTAVLQAAIHALSIAGGGRLILDGAFLVSGLQHESNVSIEGLGWDTGLYHINTSGKSTIRNKYRCISYYSNVAGAAPGTSGTSITVTAGTGQYFDPPAFPYYVSVTSSGVTEYMLVTGKSGDVLTVTRNTLPAGSSLKTGPVNITAGMQIQEAPVDVNMALKNLTINSNYDSSNPTGDWPGLNISAPTLTYVGWQNLTFENIQILNSVEWASIIGNGSRLRINGYREHRDNIGYPSGDNIHFWGPLSDVIGKDGYGNGRSDSMGLNFGEAISAQSNLYGVIAYVSVGGCKDFFWDGFVADGASNGIRVLGYSGTFPGLQSLLIDNVVIKNFTVLTNAPVDGVNISANGYQRCYITIDNCSTIGTMEIDNFRDMTNTGIVLIVSNEFAANGGAVPGTIGKIIVKDTQFDNNLPGGVLTVGVANINGPVSVLPGSVIGKLVFENCDMTRVNSGPYAVIAGSVSSLEVRDSYINNADYIAYVAAGGSLGTLETAGVQAVNVTNACGIGSGVTAPAVLLGVSGPSSSTAGHLATFADASGQVMQDGGAATLDAIADGSTRKLANYLTIGGTAAAVTGATFTKPLTVDTGNVTIHGNAANTSALTLGAGASSVSGSNTGDQTSITGNAATATQLASAVTINGVSFNGSAGISGAASGIVEQIDMEDSNSGIAAQTYTLRLYAEYGFTINELRIVLRRRGRARPR